MALSCNIINSPRYQTMKDMSGISDFSLNRAIEKSLQQYGDYPQLDMIPYSDSSEYLKKQINTKTIKDSNYAKTEDIVNYIGATSIEDANIKINNLHRDVNVDIYPIDDETNVITIEKRPSEFEVKKQEELDLDDELPDTASANIIETQLELMQNRFGIKIIPITNAELSQDKWSMIAPESRMANAFIYNNDIYINTDNANIKEAKMHELMHIFLGGIRFTNPNLYFSLVQTVEQLPNYQSEAMAYVGRTQGDIDEEIFVKEFAKYLTSQPSLFQTFDKITINNIMYEINRNIDNFIDGKYSVKTCDFNQVLDSTVSDLIKALNSPLGITRYSKIIDEANVHRIMANTKEDLMKKQELIQECS